VNCVIQFIENGPEPKIEITESRTVDKDPFVVERCWILLPSQPPYDFSFWKDSLQNALATFRWDQDRLSFENSLEITRHMNERLLSPSDWASVELGVTPKKYSKGELICAPVMFF
jgi:hypothetical protein